MAKAPNSDTAQRLDALERRYAALERAVKYSETRRKLMPVIVELCRSHGLTLPAPDADGFIDARQILMDLRDRQGRGSEAAANRLSRMLSEAGLTA